MKNSQKCRRGYTTKISGSFGDSDTLNPDFADAAAGESDLVSRAVGFGRKDDHKVFTYETFPHLDSKHKKQKSLQPKRILRLQAWRLPTRAEDGGAKAQLAAFATAKRESAEGKHDCGGGTWFGNRVG